MNTICMTIETDGNLHPVSEEQALAEWRDGQCPVWIDLHSDNVDEMIAWVRELGLDQELTDLLQTGGHATKIVPLDEAVYFEYPILSSNEAEESELFACLCLDRLVVTMHERPLTEARVADAALPHLRLHEATASGLVCSLTILQSVQLRRHAIQLRNRARRLADLMDEEPESVPLVDILELKHEVLELDGVTSDQLATFELLQAVDKPVLHLARMGELFQIALGNTRATDRSIDRLDSGVRDLQQRHESAQQDKTNRRLAVLTVLSAIFSPLTLLAGIYGMNFAYMPELGYHYAYFIALGAMAVIAGGLYWFFRSRGWLR